MILNFKLKKSYLKLFLGLVAIVQLLIVWQYGIGLSEDSISYKYAAQTLLQQGEMLNVDASKYTHWPPLMPLLIAFLELLSSDLLFLIPVFAFALLLLATYKWSLELKMKLPWKFALVTLIAVNFAVSYTARVLWSDLLFLSLLLFWLLALRKNKLFHVIIGFIILSLLRYAALFFLPLFIYYLYRNTKVKGKFIQYFFAVLISFIPISVWLVYTYSVSGHISGERIFPSTFYPDHYRSAITELGRWIVPAAFPFIFHLLAALLVILLPIWLVKKYPYVILAHLFYAAGFFLSYFLFDMQNPDARLLLPLLPAFVYTLVYFLQKFAREKKYALLSIVLLVACYSVIRGAKNWFEISQGNYGKYATIYWQDIKESNLCKLLEASENQLMSNDAYGVNYLCNQTCFIWPKDRHFSSENLPQKGTFISFRQQDPYRLYTSTAILSVYKTDTLKINEKWILLGLEAY